MAPNILIRDVPDSTHGVLVERAKAEGKSLQEYLLQNLTVLAARPTMAEIMDEVEAALGDPGRPTLTASRAVELIRLDREDEAS
jgi:pyocin large subunit-like protein